MIPAASPEPEAVRAAGLEDAVRFIPFQPENELSEMFAAADVLLVSQLNAVKDTLIPGKLLTYMAAGRPIIAAANPASQAGQLLRQADGGVLVTPENPEALAAAVRNLADADPDVLTAFGARNRAYAERHFDQRRILAAHEEFLLNTIHRRPTSEPAA